MTGSTTATRPQLGVLLLNLGGPDKLEDVYTFLYNLFSDPDLIRLPLPCLQKPLAALIAAVRVPLSQENYASIGGGSPLRQITEDQAEHLRLKLCQRGVDCKVYVGMRYWHPYTEEAIAQIQADGITDLAVIPLYPQYSISTTGSSLKLLDKLWQSSPKLQKIQRYLIKSWYDRPLYIKAMAELIDQRLQTLATPSDAHIFFSAHGVPKNYVTKYGDSYQVEMENCVDGIMQFLRQEYHYYNAHTLAYQSRVGPVTWLQPYTEEAIEQLAKRGIKDLVVIPISFVSEHIETLQEIDIEYRHLAESVGVNNFVRVPALNCHPLFIEMLSDLALEILPAPVPVV